MGNCVRTLIMVSMGVCSYFLDGFLGGWDASFVWSEFLFEESDILIIQLLFINED
jgi:hypothetical protein